MPAYDPQDRYIKPLETKKLPNGKLVYKSAIPKVVRHNILSDVIITASDIVRMDKLAYNAYNSPSSWWRIASANGRVDGSLFFKPGEKIIIPL